MTAAPTCSCSRQSPADSTDAFCASGATLLRAWRACSKGRLCAGDGETWLIRRGGWARLDRNDGQIRVGSRGWLASQPPRAAMSGGRQVSAGGPVLRVRPGTSSRIA
jgi:hypothetical protein